MVADGSVVLAGYTDRVWGGENYSGFDVIATKLDYEDATELECWQVRPEHLPRRPAD